MSVYWVDPLQKRYTEDWIHNIGEAVMMDMGGCASSEPFALRVLGDSMVPEFEDGCIIIIDPAGSVENGSYVLAVHNEEYIFRQLIIADDGYYLKPLNNGYETLEISGIDAIKGVIVQKAGTRRRHRKHYVHLNREADLN